MSDLLDNRFSVLVTGLLRTPDVLMRSVDSWNRLRDEGLVDRVVMVTWESERDRTPDLCAQLAARGVEMVIRPDTPVRGIGNIWPQMLAMDIGLQELCSDGQGGGRVFKTRADLWLDPGVLSSIATTPGYLEAGSSVFADIFASRVWIPWFEMTTPFYWSDECFFGRADDLRLLINYDESYSLCYPTACGVTHYRRFVHPFRGRSEAVERFLDRYTDTGIGSEDRWGRLEALLADDAYLESLAASYAALGSCFRVGCPDGSIEFRDWSTGTPSPDPARGSLGSCFAPEHAGLSLGHLFCHDDAWLHALLRGVLPGDPVGERFSSAMERIGSSSADWCSPPVPMSPTGVVGAA